MNESTEKSSSVRIHSTKKWYKSKRIRIYTVFL